MIGYMCAYLRYYYPKEFITAYLNNANNDDDIKLGTSLAKQLGIPVHSIQFRHSIAEYSCDKNGIYKGLSSIKYMNDEAANDLYSIRNEKFDTFIDLLIRINTLNIDSRKLDILIKLDFFAEFGNIRYLLTCNDVFCMYYGKKQLKKEKMFNEGVDFDILRRHCGKETAKTFMELDSVGLIKELVKDIPDTPTTIKQHISYQIDYLGYVDIVDEKYKRYCVVTELNVDYSPKLSLYALANGNTIQVKIDKKTFAQKPLQRKDIIKVEGYYKKPKMKKIDGKWVEGTEKEWWLRDYRVCG